MSETDARVPEGFEVVLTDRGYRGHHVEFRDGADEVLAGFPWMSHADAVVRKWSRSHYPLGSAERPFVGIEERWRLVLDSSNGVHISAP